MNYSLSFSGSPPTTFFLVAVSFILAGVGFYSLAVLDNPWLFTSCVLLIIGIISFSIGLFQWKLKRIIENTPTSTIRSIAMGLVEIAGIAAKPFNEWLISPFTKKQCAYYSCSIEELQQSGKHSKWVVIYNQHKSNPFYAKDKTGMVLVDPKSATIDTRAVYTTQTGAFSDLPNPIISFCKANNIGIKSWFGLNRSLRFTEQILPANNFVYVLGTAGDNPYIKETTAQHSMHDIMIKQEKYRPFIISDKKEKDLLSAFAWKITACLIGGSAGIVIGIVLAIGGLGWFS